VRSQISRLVVAIVLILGCSFAMAGMKVKAEKDPEADFGVYKTYAWKKGLNAAYENIQHVIEKNVNRELSQVQLVKADAEDADLYAVSYALGEQLQGTLGGFYRQPGWAWGIITTESRLITKGTLVIDLVDAQENKVVWRGVAQGNVANTEQAVRIIEQVTKKMFRKYPAP
jgi:hypothetical protein